MKGVMIKERIEQLQYDDLMTNEDYIEALKLDWHPRHRKLIRQAYTIVEWEVASLEEILTESKDMTECIAVAIRWAELNPSGNLFKRACQLAQTTTIEMLEEALYLEKEREPFVVVVLALVHYEVFNRFELGEYVVNIEIEWVGKKLIRKFIHP